MAGSIEISSLTRPARCLGEPLPAPWLVIPLTLAVFFLADNGRDLLSTHFGLGREQFTGYLDRFVWIYSWYAVPPLVLAVILFQGRALAALGLWAPIGFGVLVGFVGTLPMLIGYAGFGSLQWPNDPALSLTRATLAPGVFEEILYRGLLFGFLYRFGGVGFLPAAFLVSLVFGAAHVYQGGSPTESLAIFAITGMGAAWFAWLYIEWDHNLWVPISFHVLMNGYWHLFGVGDTALGGMTANIFRVATIVLSIVLTIAYARRTGALAIKGGSLFLNPSRG